ncbi:hypothetical protein AB0B94_31165 [Micromonospora sp. NPDC048986]|uniref:hypothetical protein n=1 Tax=Micromonospora sp. NPDC048986 TaxID=3155644 RepID=UPI0033D7D61A
MDSHPQAIEEPWQTFDILRAAAATLRKAGSAATPGPWRTHDTYLNTGGYTATVLSGPPGQSDLRAWLPTLSGKPWDERRNVWNDAAWIALVDPDLGELLAAWLESAAHDAEANGADPHAMAVAHFLLREDNRD